MTIESQLEHIHEAGFRLLNLFELDNGLWQANLYDGHKAWDFGRANTPDGALAEALRLAQMKPGEKLIENRSLLPSAVTEEEWKALLDSLF